MTRKTLCLKRLSQDLFKNGNKDMIGRSRGARLRESLERILRDEAGTLIVLDFSGLGSIDFSWADEVVAKIVSRLWGNEYGERFLVLKDLSEAQAENIGVALERKRLAALCTGPEGWKIIGSLNNYLVHTLKQVMRRQRMTLRELSEREGIGMNTSGTRLLNLYKKRLVARVERRQGARKNASHRGTQYVYQSLLS